MAKNKNKNKQSSSSSSSANTQKATATASPTPTPTPTPVATMSLTTPSTMTVAEYDDLLEQIRELPPADCAIELLDASRYGDIDIVRGVLALHPLLIHHEQAATGQTALHYAAANGRTDCCRLLCKCSGNPMAVNRQGNTPLHWAAAAGHLDTVQLLLTPQATIVIDVLQRNKAGRSILTEGFSSSNHALVEILLEHESASEERLVQTAAGNKATSAGQDDAADACTPKEAASVVHELQFGGNTRSTIKIRELAMATTDTESILGQDVDQDTTGLGIWAAALVTAAWMVAVRQRFACKTVIELGSGCGVPGIALACSNTTTTAAEVGSDATAPPTKMYLTDFNSRTVENLQHNADLNQTSSNTTAAVATEMDVRQMNWQEPSTWPDERLDYVIGSDLIYQTDMVPLLVQTVAGLLKQSADSRFLYVAPGTGRKGQEGLVAALETAGLVLVEEREAPAEYSANPLSSQDEDECFLHFNELKSARFLLYEFAWRDGTDVVA